MKTLLLLFLAGSLQAAPIFFTGQPCASGQVVILNGKGMTIVCKDGFQLGVHGKTEGKIVSCGEILVEVRFTGGHFAVVPRAFLKAKK